MNNTDMYKDMIYKEAGLLSAALTAGKAALKSGGVKSAVKTGYNTIAKAGLGKKVLIGAGIGAAKGALDYDKNKNDGSFGNSIAGKVLSGAAGGAAIGAVSHKLLKPIGMGSTTPGVSNAILTGAGKSEGAKLLTDGVKFSENIPKYPYMNGNMIEGVNYKISSLYNQYMEKHASSEVSRLAESSAKLSPRMRRILINSAIGAGIGAIKYTKFRKKEEDKKNKYPIKTLPGTMLADAASGALIGEAINNIQHLRKSGKSSKHPYMNGNFVEGVEYKISSLYNQYMEKHASSLSNKVINKIDDFKSLSPWQRLAIGAIVGAGAGAAAYRPGKKENEENDNDGMVETAIKNTPVIGKAYNKLNILSKKLDSTRGGSAAKGAAIGSAFGYVAGNKDKKW
jgi:ElaB/YqjD/DUF883 family membrane-anchored ribosome-binding protein